MLFRSSAESTDLALNKLKELKIDESKYFVEKDSNAFEESLESVSGIKHIIKIMTYSIMLGGMVVLSLILILWLRERIYEIGIFLSIGTSKIHIIHFPFSFSHTSLKVILPMTLLTKKSIKPYDYYHLSLERLSADYHLSGFHHYLLFHHFRNHS